MKVKPKEKTIFNAKIETNASFLIFLCKCTYIIYIYYSHVFKKSFETGASHSDELALLFQMPWISDVLEDSRDYNMSLDLVKLWVSFAKEDFTENK